MTQLAPGALVAGRYRVESTIAAGGMGKLLRAEDLLVGGPVALKTVRAEVARDRTALERFRREIQLARKVTHTNVCRIFDVVQHGETPVLSMELLEGETLAQRLRREGRLAPAVALPIVRQIAAGLGAAHDAGVVHRDLKPSNVILVAEKEHERVVIVDFGIARLQDGGAAGDRFATET